MADIDGDSPIQFPPEIRIVGLNTDRTRKIPGSYAVHQVYFELSGAPPSAWRDIFGREWKDLNPMQQACIDGKFLVMHCPLHEIAMTHLPGLKRAVEETNVAFRQYDREQGTEERNRGDAWKQERQAVEDMARSLRFE